MAASPASWPAADASRLAVPVWNLPLSVLFTTLRFTTLTEEKRNEMKKKNHFQVALHRFQTSLPRDCLTDAGNSSSLCQSSPLSIFIGAVSNNLLQAVRGDVQTENPFTFGHIAGKFQLEIFSIPSKPPFLSKVGVNLPRLRTSAQALSIRTLVSDHGEFWLNTNPLGEWSHPPLSLKEKAVLSHTSLSFLGVWSRPGFDVDAFCALARGVAILKVTPDSQSPF